MIFLPLKFQKNFGASRHLFFFLKFVLIKERNYATEGTKRPLLLCETLPGLLLYVAPNKATRIDNGAVGTRKTECAKLANNM